MKFRFLIFGIVLLVTTWSCNKPAANQNQSQSRIYKIGIVYFGPDEAADVAMKGLTDGLKDLGFAEGKNLEIQKTHAQGEIANIPALFQNYDNLGLDLIVPMSTPCLAEASAMVKKTPVVFMYVYDPVAAGAGKSFTDHLPKITGVGSFPPIADTVTVIREIVPGVHSVGTVYNSSEANSRKVMEVARPLFKKAEIGLEEVTVTATNEVLQAAQVLTHRNIQALWISGDNTVLQAFEGTVKAARDAHLPLIINDPEFVDRGAVVAVGIGWYETGRKAAATAARVLKGENPSQIPFENFALKKVVLNHDEAKKLGLTFPPQLEQEAAKQ